MRNRYGDRWLGFAEDALATVLQKAGFAVHSAVREPVGRGLTLLLLQADAVD